MGDTAPVTGVEELEKHLVALSESPETSLREGLIDEVVLQLTGKSAYVS